MKKTEKNKCSIGTCQSHSTQLYTKYDYFNKVHVEQWLCKEHAKEKGYEGKEKHLVSFDGYNTT